MPTFMQLCKTI